MLHGTAPTLGGNAFDYDTGAISSLAETHLNNYFNFPSNSLQGDIAAFIRAGAFVGSPLTGLFLADKLGLKQTLF